MADEEDLDHETFEIRENHEMSLLCAILSFVTFRAIRAPAPFVFRGIS